MYVVVSAILHRSKRLIGLFIQEPALFHSSLTESNAVDDPAFICDASVFTSVYL